MTWDETDAVAPAGRAGRPRPAAVRVLRVLLLTTLVLATTTAATSTRWPLAQRYALDCLAVGAHVDDEGGGAGPGRLATFLRADESMGPLTVRRSFDRRLPQSFATSAAADDAAAGLHSFVSWKPPGGDYVGAARGDYDEQVSAWARSVPRTGVYATAFHEPENDMTAEQFVALQRHLYAVVKRANPTIRWGPVYMAYWWDPGAPSHYVGDPAAWWPGEDRADFAAFDWYGRDPQPMTQSPEFRTWYSVMRPTGKPLLISEYGQYAVPSGQQPDRELQERRAAAIRTDAAWLRAHPEFHMWMYWQDDGHQGDWRLTDEASLQAWRAVAREGCPA